MNPVRLLFLPWWILSLASGAKSFTDNPVLGSRRLNRWGLHAARIRVAALLATRRRARLRRLVAPADAADLDRDGFVVKKDFLPPASFAAVREQALAYRGPARETQQGDTVTRRIALNGDALKAMPAVRAMLRAPGWRGLLRYAGSFDAEPMTYVQTILSHIRDGSPDPQTELHADTFHATVKAWLFLTDVAPDEGPFVYVPGSHVMTPARIAWEQERSMRAATGLDRLSSRGSFRIRADELRALGLPEPRVLAVPANTLVVADTSGFHARGPSIRPSMRIELWAYGRRNPFLPWTGLDVLGVNPIGPWRATLMWAMRDRLCRLIGQPWRDVGLKRAGDPVDGA